MRNIVVGHYLGGELLTEASIDVDDSKCWYTVQNYFNDNLNNDLFSFCDVIRIKWYNSKNYEFRRKTDDDPRHQAERK